ncbi:MAG: hypothetical protein KBB39_03310 [Phycicoccus sp.]|nr:hypothetical protein [Phycicoccus sp.]
MSGPRLLDESVHFRFPADDASVTGVRLEADRAVPGPRDFRRDDDGWILRVPRPEVQRLEYRLEVARGMSHETILDPTNAVMVRAVFGDRSVLELPGYQPPWWISALAGAGRSRELLLPGEHGEQLPVTMWSPEHADDDEALPLLLVHDGPEYDQLASITRYSAALIEAGQLPPHRLALAHPVLRDAWYSGSPRYLRSMAAAGLDRIGESYPVRGPVVVMGASLGGLTALLLGLAGAPRIGGVFAQSGSFFQPRTDGTESGYRWFDRITELVRQILDARYTDHPLRVGMTCGVLEENAANNRRMATALTKAGHQVTYAEVADLHNYTAWRDALDPHLTQVLRDVWGEPQG